MNENQNQNQQNPNPPNDGKVNYLVQRYVQIGGVQYGSGLYRVTPQIARALDNLGAGARQDDFIQAVAGDAPVIDASANAASNAGSNQNASIPSGIVPNVPNGQNVSMNPNPNAGEGSPNFTPPISQINDSSGANSQAAAQLTQDQQNQQLQNQAASGGAGGANGAGEAQGHRTQVENETVKNAISNQTSANETRDLNQSQGIGAGSGSANDQSDPNANESKPQGATGTLPDDFPHKEDLANAETPIKTYEDLIPKTQEELMKIKGIGKAGVRDIGLAVYTAKQQVENS